MAIVDAPFEAHRDPSGMANGDVSSPAIERIEHNGLLLSLIIRPRAQPKKTTFFTSPDINLQVGQIVYLAGQEIHRHVHLPIERHTIGSSEVLLVQTGRCALDVYTVDHELVETRELGPGDIVVAVGGGHGFRMSEDTVLLEVKQGPYPGVEEKRRF